MKKLQFVFDVECGSEFQKQSIKSIMEGFYLGTKMIFESDAKLAHKDNKISMKIVAKNLNL